MRVERYHARKWNASGAGGLTPPGSSQASFPEGHAWEKVRANQGASGIDGESIEAFEAQLPQRLEQLHEALRTDRYQPLPVRQKLIPKEGRPNEYRKLGIPAVIDRVCQQALVNRLQPIFGSSS